VGTEANPGARASRSTRPTGVVVSAEESSGAGPSWVEHRSTRRWHERSGESRNACVAQCATHGGCFQRRGIQSRSPSWVEHCSTRRWLGHNGESRRAGVGRSPTHGGSLSAPRNPVARTYVGRASSRQGSAIHLSPGSGSGRSPRSPCLAQCPGPPTESGACVGRQRVPRLVARATGGNA
jgi:hypothetical protein